MGVRIGLISVVCLTLLLGGCATATKMNKLSIGMTKPDVIELLGPPVSVSAQQGVEYLNYRFSETDDDAMYGITTPYYVRIVGGKVESFGRMGDFDSTKEPTMTLKTESAIKQDVSATTSDRPDLYTELKKLEELRNSGALTEEEFQAQKKKLLEKY